MSETGSGRDGSGTEGESKAPRGKGWLLIVPFVLTPALLYGCWQSSFLPYDDQDVIADNPVLRADTPLSRVWRPDPAQSFYYPLTLLSLRADRWLAERLPAAITGEHRWATVVRTNNLLLHAMGGLFVLGIMGALGVRGSVRTLVVTVFLLHPAACESVAWAVERKNVLAACLGLGALWLYVRDRTRLDYALASLLYGGALLAKASALGVLAVVIAWEILGRPRLGGESVPAAPAPGQGPKTSGLQRLGRVGAWIGLSALIGYAGAAVGSHLVMDPPGGSLAAAVMTDAVIVWRYVQNQVWPEGISIYYGIAPVVSLTEGRLWYSAVALLGLVAATLAATRTSCPRLTGFAWLWFAGAMGTNLNFVGINDLMHDRFAYLSTPGFWLAVGLAIDSLSQRQEEVILHLRAYGRAGVLVLAVLLGSMSMKRSSRFGDMSLLMLDAVRKEPRSAAAHIFLAYALAQKAELLRRAGDKEAELVYAQATRELETGTDPTVCPDFARVYKPWEAHLQLAALYCRQGRLPEVRQRLAMAKRSAQGKRVEAKAIAEEAWLRALVALSQGRAREALEHVDKALTYAPQNVRLYMLCGRVHQALASACERQGRIREAETHRRCAREAFARIPHGHNLYPAAEAHLKALERHALLP